MDELTIGELLDFFTLRPAGSTAYVVIGDLNLADEFRTRFETDALSAEEIEDRGEESQLRAGRWRP